MSESADTRAVATEVDRRRLLNWFLATSGTALVGTIAYPIVRYVTPPRVAEATAHEVEAGEIGDLELREKGFKIIRFGADPVILVRVDDSFFAFSATCTHLDCIVGFRKDTNQIWCNCHGGAYDLTGRNVAGPPPRPLTPYRVNLVQNTIVVSKA